MPKIQTRSINEFLLESEEKNKIADYIEQYSNLSIDEYKKQHSPKSKQDENLIEIKEKKKQCLCGLFDFIESIGTDACNYKKQKKGDKSDT